MAFQYSKEVMERFLHPKNWGKIKNPDGVADTENLRCGDIMKIYLKVKKKGNEEFVEKVKFETMGCAAAIATSDTICDLAKGKTLKRAKKIRFQEIAKKLGSLPPQKIHCANLAERAFKMALKNYEKKRKQKGSSCDLGRG